MNGSLWDGNNLEEVIKVGGEWLKDGELDGQLDYCVY